MTNELQHFTKQLNWRYATKKFDATKKVPEELFTKLLDSARLSPSSYGLQPWKYVVVSDAEVRQKLRAQAWNQPQVTDASHLVVLCSWREMTEKSINDFADRIMKERGISAEAISGYRSMMLGSLPSMQGEDGKNWMAHQVYLALGVLLSACAVAGVDACPMEGFDKEAFDKILGLEKLGLYSRVLCAIGYRDPTDELGLSKKVRFSTDEVIVRF